MHNLRAICKREEAGIEGRKSETKREGVGAEYDMRNDERCDRCRCTWLLEEAKRCVVN